MHGTSIRRIHKYSMSNELPGKSTSDPLRHAAVAMGSIKCRIHVASEELSKGSQQRK